jgi:hypothetical protein
MHPKTDQEKRGKDQKETPLRQQHRWHSSPHLFYQLFMWPTYLATLPCDTILFCIYHTNNWTRKEHEWTPYRHRSSTLVLIVLARPFWWEVRWQIDKDLRFIEQHNNAAASIKAWVLLWGRHAPVKVAVHHLKQCSVYCWRPTGPIASCPVLVTSAG